MTKPSLAPMRHSRTDAGKTIAMSSHGFTRQTMAEQILTSLRETAALMGHPHTLVSHALQGRRVEFEDLDDASKAALYGLADLLIDRGSRAFHALEFYRDANRRRLLDDHGETARKALAGKLP